MVDLLLEAKRLSELNSLSGYKKAISQFPVIHNPSPANIKRGHLYASCKYNYSHDYPPEILDYLDSYPLQLIVEVKAPDHFYAINLHRVNVLPRNFIINRLKTMFPMAFKPNSKFTNQLNITFNTVTAIMKKASNACMQYRFDRIEKIYEIPFDKWNEISQYAPPTYHNVDVAAFMEYLKKSKSRI